MWVCCTIPFQPIGYYGKEAQRCWDENELSYIKICISVFLMVLVDIYKPNMNYLNLFVTINQSIKLSHLQPYGFIKTAQDDFLKIRVTSYHNYLLICRFSAIGNVVPYGAGKQCWFLTDSSYPLTKPIQVKKFQVTAICSEKYCKYLTYIWTFWISLTENLGIMIQRNHKLERDMWKENCS